MSEEQSKVKKDYTRDVEYLNNYLAEKAIVLVQSCKHITDRWAEHNVENLFEVETKAIYFNGSFRIKVMVQSTVGAYNVIFYSRQNAISVEMVNHKPELKMAVQDFILSVMGDFIERGIESMRRETIEDNRYRLSPKGKMAKEYLLAYPLKSDDVYPKK